MTAGYLRTPGLGKGEIQKKKENANGEEEASADWPQPVRAAGADNILKAKGKTPVRQGLQTGNRHKVKALPTNDRNFLRTLFGKHECDLKGKARYTGRND